MIRSGISSLSKLGLIMPLALSACGGDDSVILDGGSRSNVDPDGTPSLGIATFEYRSALPVCSKTNQSQVYYVSSEDQLYYCDGSKLYELYLDCDPSWLTDTIAAKTSVCSNGGTVIRSGPDANENDKLDTKEIKSTSTVCNGKDGKNGTNGRDGAVGATGPQGPAGVNGQNGATGATGAQGPAGVQGPAGTSCTVLDNGDHTKTLSCEDGTSVTIHDGSEGASGPQGPAGANGQGGATGPQGIPGPAGSSCTVVANGDNSYDITCPDGSHATVHDGQNGQNATLGPVLLNIVPEPKGATCHAGGHRVDVGIDVDHSGVLESDEVTGSDYACAPVITIYGNLSLSSDADLEQLRGVREITGSLQVTGSVTEAALAAAATDLSSVEDLYILSTTALTSLSFDHLAINDQVVIGDNAALTSFSFDRLASIGSLYIQGNPALTSFSFDQLQTITSQLSIANDAALTTLSGLDTLGHVGSFNIYSNVSLPTCEAQRIRNNLDNNPFTYIVGNAGVCAP